MFFSGWEMQYNENSHSYGQLVIGSLITTMHPLMHHVCCRVFFSKTSHHAGYSATLQPRFGALQLPAFPKTKITFEREEISDCPWGSGKYDGAADGDSNRGFCRVFWTVEETLGELCEVPRCLLWRGLRPHCPVYSVLVSCIFFNKCSINVSIFRITWLDTFWTDLVYVWIFYN